LINLEPARMAAAMNAAISTRGGAGLPLSASIDSREIEGGELFFGLTGETDDGGRFAPDALENGAWGVVVSPEMAGKAAGGAGWVFATEDPLLALQSLATAWRRELGPTVIGITGSVGKTSVKDITRALLPGAVHASQENFNTEIGLPLTILSAPEGTEILVLEMAMRGAGQIAELATIAEPDIAVITVVGPVHLELLGSIEAIAAAKAELVEGLRPGSPVIVPVDAGHLEPHLGSVPGVLRFGPGGDVYAEDVKSSGEGTVATVITPAGKAEFRFSFTEQHNLTNALAAIAAGIAAGADPEDLASRAGSVAFSRFRGEHITLESGALVVNDSYNANPVSMRAALEYLAGIDSGQRVAVLGLMAELGPDAARFHNEVGLLARDLGIDLLISVGPMAAEYGPDHLVEEPDAAVSLLGDVLERDGVVLIKGSRAAGLEAVAEGLVSQTAGRGGGT
jgi:UDP-N-acetylmuramoyl-tripeptide--D-alanyl-D-alanine ligase